MKEDYKGPVEYSIEIAVETIEILLKDDYGLSRRAIALLLLQDDREIREMVKRKEPGALGKIDDILNEAKSHYINPITYELALERQNAVKAITARVVKVKKGNAPFREKLSRLTMNPLTGLPILFFVLYWGLYKFVGQFGAGTVVNFLEGTIFEKYLNPFITGIFTKIVPWEVLRDLFVGEYGLITLGFRYAVALILPLVTFFFIVFSIIEDTGYLPRLAMLIDRVFKKIGLSGRAVIPMVLGLGCDTMATMVTRTLPTKRERIISTMLLALAVPCSAQLGVILALLEGKPRAMFIWAGTVVLIFLFVGYLTAKLLPGERPSFYMEIPPLRLPKLSNVLTKTYVRVKWYFKEVLPLFLTASVLIWFGQLTGLFNIFINILKKPVKLIGLPPEAASVFLFGFFRRDYGAAGLYDLTKRGYLDGVELVVACVALTLFLPCIAQFLMNVRERGWKMGFGISAFILFFSFSAAYILNFILTKTGVAL
ncbi:MAG: ferrous iron transporter B [Omnitrophica bacterium]|nr:ferrous iron transporter B [Candidatus Omnitrophota bacterium]